MPNTYRAILTGDRLDWLGEKPARTDATPVEVVVHDQPMLGAVRSDGAGMVEALEDLGGLGVYRRFDDPVRWQRMVREDRPLPGRD
jgi:hypothetical protein